MKSAIMIFMAVVIACFLPSALSGINDFRSTSQTGMYIATTTTPDTSANVTLVASLFDADVVNVTAVTSTDTADAPLAAAYTTATKVLRIDGLETNASRTLTVTYKRAALGSFTGADLGVLILPLVMILGILGLIAGAVVTAMRHGE